MSPTDKDWNAEWMRLSERRAVLHDASYWDRRACEYAGGDDVSPYIAGFIAAMRIRPGESVLDVGCGSGALALPLARAGHEVIAVDFSEGMLAALRRSIGQDELRRVRTVLAGWDDDWRRRGIGRADLAVASRSLDVRDLRAALLKLDAFARRRVCVTVPVEGVFYTQLLAHAAIDRPYERRGDHHVAVRVLRQMGIDPEVRFLDHARVDHFESPEAAAESLARLIAPADERERRRLDRYLADHLVATTDEDGRRVWTQEPAIPVRWAFLAWDKPGTRAPHANEDGPSSGE